MQCTTCRMISLIDGTYPVRPARFGVSNGRCLWHAWEEDAVWRCDACGRFTNAEEIAFCLKSRKFFCASCSTSTESGDSFWLWSHALLVSCPSCLSPHPTLVGQEFSGDHPWQADPLVCLDFPIWYPGGRLITKEEAEKI